MLNGQDRFPENYEIIRKCLNSSVMAFPSSALQRLEAMFCAPVEFLNRDNIQNFTYSVVKH